MPTVTNQPGLDGLLIAEQRTLIAAQQERIAALVEGLRRIGGGHIPGLAEWALDGNWKAFADKLQAEARALLEGEGNA